MKILITICARGGSKGIPGKNIKLINQKPLIAYSIEQANRLADKFTIKLALSTDDSAIKMKAAEFGLYTDYLRPQNLASDIAGKVETIKDLLLYEERLAGHKYDFILDLDVTSPLRTLEDLEKSLELMISSPSAKTLFSVNNATRNPYFNMVEVNQSGFYSLVKTNPDGSVMTRQSAPKVYELNASFYWYRRSFFDANFKSVITDKSLIYPMEHICFDLDHPIDFLFMEYLLQNNKLDFKL
ncbi:cytidylyltransferase domain-containing protein [Sediminibacterium sp.]|uniref:acylneuraminate cytidylyltransferase family protein n=1 Tax=Sediminibacterium sp. TaxID=1917865 RepID=UPI00272F1D5C|nr:acylneuraminate cytidylyltransferase family protein [Sediminibacterium sp.]MDP2420232.1 acylneuraminate cytidylyltransferase family protein [Sediminibacterium sp.]